MWNPVETVVTGHGESRAGVTIETLPPLLAAQILTPSKARRGGLVPERWLATIVDGSPAGGGGSIL